MARGGKLARIGWGGHLTSTLHITNLCYGIELALRRGRGGQVYFITHGAPSAFRDFVSEMLGTQGLAAPDKSTSRTLVPTIDRLGDLTARWTDGRITPPPTLQAYAASAVEITLDITKARDELGYTRPISRAEGMTELRASRIGTSSHDG